MTDLIPRDAAIRAVNLAIWKSPIKAQISTIDASNDTAEALHAIPAIDPAAIREAAVEIWKLANSRDPDDPMFIAAILAMIGEKK